MLRNVFDLRWRRSISAGGADDDTQMAAPDEVEQLLASLAGCATELTYDAGEVIYAQGEVADSIFYVRHGRIKCLAVSGEGKHGVVALHRSGHFFGEGSVIGHRKRLMTAVAMTRCSVTQIEKSAMVRLLHEKPDWAGIFISSLIAQSLQYEDTLVGHLFNSAEKRLARALLTLSETGSEDGREGGIPRITQETFAEIVGTTRSRINHFMNKFRQLGLVEYNGEIRVNRARITKMLLEEVALAVRRPGSWEGARMTDLLTSHGYSVE